jgi:hypothetical protein
MYFLAVLPPYRPPTPEVSNSLRQRGSGRNHHGIQQGRVAIYDPRSRRSYTVRLVAGRLVQLTMHVAFGYALEHSVSMPVLTLKA